MAFYTRNVPVWTVRYARHGSAPNCFNVKSHGTTCFPVKATGGFLRHPSDEHKRLRKRPDMEISRCLRVFQQLLGFSFRSLKTISTFAHRSGQTVTVRPCQTAHAAGGRRPEVWVSFPEYGSRVVLWQRFMENHGVTVDPVKLNISTLARAATLGDAEDSFFISFDV